MVTSSKLGCRVWALTGQGGHIKPDVYYNLLKYTEKYGAKQTAEFARFEASNVVAVKDVVEKEQIDCDFVLTRALDVYLNEEHATATREAYHKLTRIGAADVADLHYIEGVHAERVSWACRERSQ